MSGDSDAQSSTRVDQGIVVWTKSKLDRLRACGTDAAWLLTECGHVIEFEVVVSYLCIIC